MGNRPGSFHGHVRTLSVAVLLASSLVVPGLSSVAWAAPLCDGLAATITGSGSISGTTHDDVIVGSAGKDAINGRGGNDAICALGGADKVTDGPGDDTVYGGGGADTFFEGSTANGADSISGDSGADTIDYAQRVAAVDVSLGVASTPDGETGEGDDLTTVERAVGGAGFDTLTGTDGNNVLRGGAGNDLLDALDGADLLVGGQGDDDERGGYGSDTFDQGIAADGMDILNAGDSHEPLSSIDVVDYSGRTNDVTASLSGQAISGEAGEGDTLIGLVEDTLLGSGNDTATGNTLDNVIDGGPGNDDLRGLGGVDSIAGGSGNDRLVGGFEVDALSTGDGADSVVYDFTTSSNWDTVGDFTSGADVISVDVSALSIGDGDATLEGAITRATSGGWSASNELVIFTSNSAPVTSPSTAVAVAGAATTPMPVNRRALFAIDDGSSTALWLFTSADGNASVSTSELTLVTHLTATPSTVATDYQFVP